MVNDLDDFKDYKRGGMFRNRWMDFSLRNNVQDGRCWIEGNGGNATDVEIFTFVPRLQKSEYIDNWRFLEYPDRDSELIVKMSWTVVLDQKQFDYESNICQANFSDPNSGVVICDVKHARYAGVDFRLYRIDGDVTTKEFIRSSTQVTLIGTFDKNFVISNNNDTNSDYIVNGGQNVYLRSDLKFSPDGLSSWTEIYFDKNFSGPEKTDKRLQTNTYYYITVDPDTTYQQTLPANTRTGVVPPPTVVASFHAIGSSSPNATIRPIQSYSIIDSNNQGYKYYAFQDKVTNNDYFAWFITPPTFERKKKTIPSIRWGNFSDIANQSSTTSPDTLGKVKGTQATGDPTKYDIELKGTFFYTTLDFDSNNSLRIPTDIPEYYGFEAKNLSEPGSTFVRVYQEYAYGTFFNNYVWSLPTGLGGDDQGRRIDFSYKFQAKANTQWLYRIWLQKADGEVWYSNTTTSISSPYLSSVTPSDLPITTGEFRVTNWVDPNSNSYGFWYQMLKCWTNKTAANRLSPYMTVLTKKVGGNAVAGVNTNVDKDYPVFYYLNYTFTADKTYQFRTVLENFYTYRKDTSAKLANLHIITPWGEKMKMNAPFINLDNVPNELKRVNMYLFTNINAYSKANNPNIADVNGDVPTKPINIISSKTNPQNPITYTAKPFFGGDITLDEISLSSGLNWVDLIQFEWFLQGAATFNVMNQTANGQVQAYGTETIPQFVNNVPFGGRGWHYLSDQKKFVWFDKVGPGDNLTNLKKELNDNFPIGGDPGENYTNKSSDIKYLRNNFIATYVYYQNFNVSFDYVNNSPFGISMYLGGDLPFAKEGDEFWKTDIDDLIANGLVKLVGKLGPSTNNPQNCEFVGLIGNQYLFFVADNVIKFGDSEVSPGLFYKSTVNNEDKYYFNDISTGYPINNDNNTYGFSTYSVISLYNFTFAGAYNEGNNEVYLMNSNFSTSLLSNATYSIKLGIGNNVFPNSANTTTTTNSKAGNGYFTGGTWENGVWNNGWREDITVAEFNTVEQSFFYNRARIWRISIGGRPSSVSKFAAGDVVSISNVVAIDINENRKLLNKSYKVLSVDETTITVETETNFPLKRIEKDSEEHRILISKNVWLSGVFLNGYFSGVWNNGLFSGFPLITKMKNSHWIDGIFNGGQFTAGKLKSTFQSVKSYTQDGTRRLALNFTRPHGMEPNDTISITYNAFNKVDSLGTTTIISTPDDRTIVTGLVYDNKYKNIKIGTVNNTISTGLIQNFNFYSNNKSTVTSLQSMKSERVFSYNSWIDVNYSNKSAVNIGRPQNFIEPLTGRSYSENNLYGYPTNDVLSSDSVFRDSFSLSSRRYKFGRKYRVLNDFVGASSAFEQDFGPTDTSDGLDSFNTQGWDVSKFNSSTYRIQNVGSDWKPNLSLIFNPNTTISTIKLGQNITIVGPKALFSGLYFFPESLSYETETVQVVGVQSSGGKIIIDTDSVGMNDPYRWVVGSMVNYSIPFYIEFVSVNEININRTAEPVTTNTPLVGKEMKAVVSGKGGVVNLIRAEDVTNRTNGKDLETIGRLRYTMVEFEVADFRTNGTTFLYDDNEVKSVPPLHFNNLNYVTRLARDGNGQKTLRKMGASYLPIYRNVNHISTPGKKKQEFFFNKRNLLLNMTGSGYGGIFKNEFYLDNLKFYEVDMIPFFQYFNSPVGRKGNINISVQIPNTGISPNIQPTEDFTDATAGNDVVNEFAEKFIASNVQVPKNVNWRADYMIYRTQQQDLTGNPGLYGDN
jgi:hypothetical protein